MTSAAPTLALQIDHVTVVAPELEALRAFFCDVVGLVDGPRPAFRSRGHWLYLGDRPAVHLIQAGALARGGASTPRIDHVAFRVHRPCDWAALVGRLDGLGIPFVQQDVPAQRERQLFVAVTPGVQIEFVTAIAPHA